MPEITEWVSLKSHVKKGYSELICEVDPYPSKCLGIVVSPRIVKENKLIEACDICQWGSFIGAESSTFDQ